MWRVLILCVVEPILRILLHKYKLDQLVMVTSMGFQIYETDWF